MVLHLGPAALIMRFSWLCPIILTHPCAFNVCEADNFVCIWRQKAPGRCPSPTSASPAPTGQSDIAGSGDNDNYNYAIHIRRLKTPGCAAGMLRALFQLSGADNFFMVCYGRPSRVLSHAQASTTLHCISARISDSWASQPNKPNVHCQFQQHILLLNALLLTNTIVGTCHYLPKTIGLL